MRGRGPYCIRDGRVDVEVSFLKKSDKKPDSSEGARKSNELFKKNISYFYSAVYAGMTGEKGFARLPS